MACRAMCAGVALVLVMVAAVGCGRSSRRGGGPRRDSGPGGFDAGPGVDSGPGIDAGRRDTGPIGFDSGPECLFPREECPSGCTDTTTDTRNCGSCGFTCTTGWLCVDSSCTDPGGPGTEGQVRLVGGELSTEGRVEIYHEGVWGTICDDNWDNVDATVACRQLGYTTGVACGTACFGEGLGTVWMDGINCTGSESSLASCPFDGWAVEDCTHPEDSGATCSF